MKSDEWLTEKLLQGILVYVYKKGQETENISVIEDIKQQFLPYITK